jgi:hypothetical protein
MGRVFLPSPFGMYTRRTGGTASQQCVLLGNGGL